MLEIFQDFVSVLLASPVAALVTTPNIPNAQPNIYTGPVDQVMEKQSSLLYPAIILSQVSEVQRSVPIHARDTVVQLDIYSRNDQMELETIYEAVITALSYQTTDVGSSGAHIFWDRLNGAVDIFESDRRMWHRACSFMVWSIKE
jgi:hypothetical protein